MHSQGEWFYAEMPEWGGDGKTYGQVRCRVGDRERVIVNGCAPGGTEEANDNCRLMAASPDLLEACIGLVDWAGAANNVDSRVSAARQAIAKALGQ